jgi:hypothetical protein
MRSLGHSTSEHGHTHGMRRPCNIRCGGNEGLCVRNDQHNVTCLFTDGLVCCTQVIFRNATATFTCHILEGAPDPEGWIDWAKREFTAAYGAITSCWVVTGDNVGAGDTVCSFLRRDLAVERITGCGGCAIRIADGTVMKTPRDWHTGRPDVAGAQTARGLIDLRLHSRRVYLGEITVGDYYEPCPECNRRF